MHETDGNTADQDDDRDADDRTAEGPDPSDRETGGVDADAVASEIAGACLAVGTRRLARMVTAIYDDEIRALGVTTAQGNILVAVKRMGLARPHKLAEVLAMEKSTVSRAVARMAENGWLRKVPAADGRGHALVVTPAGDRLLVRAHPAWRRAQRRARALLGPAAADALGRFRPGGG